MVIDARGQGCPKPVMMAEEALSKITEGIVEVIVDNEGSADNLERLAKRNAFYFEVISDGYDWRVKIVKGYVCAPATAAEEAPKAEKNLLLVVSTDTLGKEEELGKMLMKAYFETMKAYKQLPHTIFFLNAGVKLTTMNEEIVTVLKDIEAMGVEIYSCGTCLKHYNLESQLRVGHRGTTNHIVEGIMDFSKTVWIG
ncbi:MAG TPA: sulfurtransferase-like selenium metabolism protein YedF [Candidatus Sulfobium mesophilum]|jgi:selenium metabolism protein YedF|nr:sulfurtransferase-like selenium metabolism protein YedF [Candidatus Sulfobium mesophilum]